MGWIVEPSPGTFRLGPDIVQEFRSDTIPTPTDVLNARNKPAFWSVDGPYFLMSMSCNWRFVHLNVRFHPTTELAPTRSLFVHCDAGTSGMVGNQVTDLLREIKYQTNKTTYFEPQHIHDLPVRSGLMEIIETQVKETNGDPVTILTLHFKKRVKHHPGRETSGCPFTWRCPVMPTDANFLKIKPIRSRFVYRIPSTCTGVNGKWG